MKLSALSAQYLCHNSIYCYLRKSNCIGNSRNKAIKIRNVSFTLFKFQLQNISEEFIEFSLVFISYCYVFIVSMIYLLNLLTKNRSLCI